jgi:hypothetical protein
MMTVKTSTSRWGCYRVGVWLLAGCLTSVAADVYVSPAGSDTNPGSREKPLASIEAARDIVRAQIANGMKSDITVHLGAGNYFIESAIVFDDRDAGRNGHTITYRGAPNLATRIYGGRRITGWTKGSDGEYRASVPDLQKHFTLYENDQAANGGLFHRFAGETQGNCARRGTTLVYYPRNLPIEDQVVVLGTTKDVFVVKGRTNKQIVRNLVFDGLHMIGSDFTASWPGGVTEFPAWTGVYDGVQIDKIPLGVIFPEARHGQFFVENAENIVIRNSKLYGAGFMAVFFHRWAQNNRVENCWIENAGCSGVFFQGWEPGRGGSEGITTLEAAYCNKFNVVRNNIFHDIGRFQNDGAAIYLCWSGDNTIEHNRIHGVSRYGISLKGWRPKMINNLYYWIFNPREDKQDGQKFAYDQAHITYYDGYVVTQANQGAELNHSRNNKIRYNDISQIGRIGYDYGMIEAWGAGYDNVWAYNAGHDSVAVSSWDGAWLNALYVDDGAHRTTIEGNIVYWYAGGNMAGVICSKGNYQINRHNIIADCESNWATAFGPFVEQAHSATWVNNIVASQFERALNIGNKVIDGIEAPAVATNKNNLYYYQPLDRADGDGRTVSVSRGDISADPQFDRKNPWWDAHYTDYRLKAPSPALAQGFKETDMSLIGLRPDFPFDENEILGQSAGRIRLAANYNRLLKVRVSGEQIQSRRGEPLPVNSWVRYNNVDFGNGAFQRFRAQLGWRSSDKSFVKTINGETFYALKTADSYSEHPYWEVSPVYHVEGKTGPELFDVVFAPETDPESVKWKVVTGPLVSRQTVEYPLGVMNLDVVNGEENANGAAYMRSSFFSNGSGVRGVEVSGKHGVRIWVNGKEVFAQLGGVNKKKVDMAFQKGWNTIVVKVVQDDKPWEVYRDNGNFWASMKIYYQAMGGAYILPGLPGEETSIPPNPGAAIELRLGAPDGKLIGSLMFNEDTCPIEKVMGRHDLFLTFPNGNVRSVDWYRFE